jgi:hypothetical protein
MRAHSPHEFTSDLPRVLNAIARESSTLLRKITIRPDDLYDDARAWFSEFSID